MLAQAPESPFVVTEPNTGPEFDLDLNNEKLAASAARDRPL